MLKLPYDLIVFDLEMNNGSVIEIGAVKLSRHNKLGGDPYQSLVYHLVPIEDDVKKLTGITDDMVRNAPPFINVIRDFHTWATKETSNVVLACFGDDASDLEKDCIEYEIAYPFRHKQLNISSII